MWPRREARIGSCRPAEPLWLVPLVVDPSVREVRGDLPRRESRELADIGRRRGLHQAASSQADRTATRIRRSSSRPASTHSAGVVSSSGYTVMTHDATTRAS